MQLTLIGAGDGRDADPLRVFLHECGSTPGSVQAAVTDLVLEVRGCCCCLPLSCRNYVHACKSGPAQHSACQMHNVHAYALLCMWGHAGACHMAGHRCC